MKRLARSAILITILLVLSKVLGFGREIFLAHQFGTTYIVDAYTVSITLPSVLFTIFASGISQSYIPIITRIKTIDEKKKFFSNVTAFLTLISFAVAFICFFGSNTIASVMAPGFDERTLALTSRFIKIIVTILPFMTLFNLLSAHVSASEDFLLAHFCDSIVINVILVLSIIVATKEKVDLLAYGYVLSMVVAVAILWLSAWKKEDLTISFKIDLTDSNLREILVLAIPLGLSLFANQLNALADRMFSSILGEGVTSAISYANKVQSIFLTLTTSVFLTVCYPRINMHFANNDNENGMFYLKKAFLIACYTSLPMVVVLFIYSVPVVQVMFEGGMFTANSTKITAGCLSYYSLGIPFYAFREIATRALAANKKQKLILKNTVLSVALNVCFNLLFINRLGYVGLALATSLAGMLSFILMMVDLERMGLSLFEKNQFKDLLKIILSTAITLIFNTILYQCLGKVMSSNFAFMISIGVSALVYITSTVVLRTQIIIWVYDRLPAKLRIL